MWMCNVWDYLEKAVKCYPDKIAFIDEVEELTYQEIYQEAIKIGNLISIRTNRAVREPIAVYMKKSVRCIVAFLGIIYSGNFYVPIDTKAPMLRIKKILENLSPTAIIYADSEERLDGNWENLLFSEAMQESDKRFYDMKHAILDVDPLYVMFTSGSTGIPKGVVVSHRSVIDYIEWLSDTFHFDETVVFGNQAPFYFDNSILDFYMTLCCGATMVIIPEMLFSFSGRLLEYMENKKINTIFWVPSALIGIANSDAFNKVKLPKLEKILFCGEVMPNKQLNMWRRQYPEALYANLYGPTEITDVCSYYIINRSFEDDEVLPIGQACRNTEILVLNENDELVKDNEVGELCVRGISLSKGYYGDFAKTEEVFVQSPLNNKWKDLIYRTGDLVKYNDKNEIIYICRKDYQIKHQGYRIELGEIETAVASVLGVLRAAAVYDDKNRSILVFCVAKDIEPKSIYKELKNKIPQYMLPDKITLVDQMPMNANGKIDRGFLRNLLEN